MTGFKRIDSDAVTIFMNNPSHIKNFDEIAKNLSPAAIDALELALAKSVLEQKARNHDLFAQSEMKNADIDGDGMLSDTEFRNWFRSRALMRALRPDPQSSSAHDYLNSNPSMQQLAKLFIRSGAPFFAFGCVDNFIMVMAGGAIEDTVGVALGLTTMTAAGLGNMLADSVGIGMGRWIELGADKLGLPDPKLTANQALSRSARITAMTSGMVCICLGCLVGMSPLWLWDRRN